MDQYTAVDFYGFDANLSDEERAIKKTIRRFVDERFMPVIRDHFAAGSFPVELIPELADLQVLGAAIEGPGCPGLSHTVYGLICEELERGDSGLRSFVSVQGSLVMWPIATYGSQEQKEKWLPELAAGRKIGAFALTEPDHGSDPGSMSTTAVADGDDWILNGAKMWITNAVSADVSVVWARGPEKIMGFLVEKDTPGFAGRETRRKFSLRASETGEISLRDVRVPEANRLPDALGLIAPLSCLNEARYGIAWGSVGAASDCYSTALNYSLERKQFNEPLGSFQLVQRKLVNMLTEITKAQGLCLQLGRMKDKGCNNTPMTSLAKRNNVAMALECARTARSILGAAGITDDFSPGRHMANLESVITYEGTHDIHTLIVGAAITGKPAFR